VFALPEGNRRRSRTRRAASERNAVSAAVKVIMTIGRCPACGEFPCAWSTMGVDCTECGVELHCNLKDKDDGSEHWSFNFASQEDAEEHEKKHRGSRWDGTSWRRPSRATQPPPSQPTGTSREKGTP
jgi:hypothetical protein